MRSWRDGTAQVVVREEVLAVGGEQLERLLAALVRVDRRAADAVAEEIAALVLAGGTIRLTPTEAEFSALEEALAALARTAPLEPVLVRLSEVCRADGSLPERRPA